MNPDLTLRAKRLLNELKQTRVVSKAASWWQSHEGMAARQALSVWLRKLTESQPLVRVEPVEAKRVVARANKGDQTAAILRDWIAKNGQQLDRHPDYEKLSEEEKRQVALRGRYTLEAVHLLVATVKTVLGRVPEGFEQKWFPNRRGVYIPITMLVEHPKLLQWCKDNAHRIKDHPRYQDQDSLEALGSYELETIALPQEEYERILGFMPENVKQRDLTLGGEGRRRRLYVYTITEEPPF